MTILDTSALVRFATKDIIERSNKIKELIDSSEELRIPDVVFPELEYVLAGSYGAKKYKLVKLFRFLTSPRFITSSEVKKAVFIFSNNTLDMADCIILASCAKGDSLASFDKKLLKTYENEK